MSTVNVKTNYGNIVIELDAEKAPKTVENFLAYVDTEHFNNSIFHRVIKGFMIQGGGMDENMQEKSTRASIENEADNGLKNVKGSIAMARTMDPHSASSQFFINLVDNTFLNHTSKDTQGWGYCVFGQVTQGIEIVENIGEVATTTRGGHQDVPADPVVIESISVV